MGILNFFKDPFGIEKRVEEKVKQRITSAISRDKEDEGWRRITDVARSRNLAPIKQDRMIRVVDWLEERNPQAKRILKLIADFTLGDGLRFQAKDENVQRILEKFWENNQLDLNQFQKIEDLSKYGELIFEVYVDKQNGEVILQDVDPESIAEVIVQDLGYQRIEKVKLKQGSSKEILEVMHVNRKLRVIKDENGNIIETREPNKIYGDLFFFRINKGTFATRGKSDLLPIADWLDKYDKTLFTMTERISFLLAFVWDIMIEGANEQQLRNRLRELQMNPPKPGSFQVHNDREQWKAVSPDLRAQDLTNFFKLLEEQLTSGSGLPYHWLFGFGDTTNRATALAMSEPVHKMIKRRQGYILYMFSFIFDYVIQQAIDHQILSPGVDKDYDIVLPDPSKAEVFQTAETVQKLVPALSVAVTNGLLDTETARRLLSNILGEFGIEVTAQDIEKNIQQESLNPRIYEAVKNLIKQLEKKR